MNVVSAYILCSKCYIIIGSDILILAESVLIIGKTSQSLKKK